MRVCYPHAGEQTAPLVLQLMHPLRKFIVMSPSPVSGDRKGPAMVKYSI